MWQGRVNARPSRRPTKACVHMREDWQGAAAISMAAPCALSAAADTVPLCFVWFSELAVVWYPELWGGSWSHTHTAQHALRRQCTTRPGVVDWHPPHEYRRAQSIVRTHTHTHTRSSSSSSSSSNNSSSYFLQVAPRIEAVGVLVFSIFAILIFDILVAVFGRCHNLECKNLIFAVPRGARRKDDVLEQ